MGMKNHEVVPLPLISAVAGIHRGATHRILSDLIKNRLTGYDRGKKFDGYRLTVLGYDYLALRALCAREVVGSVGNQIGVGKESDVYVGGDPARNDLVLKLHRLGRTSFRKIKEKRDYHKKRHFCSWLYLSRIAALKEFTFLKALHDRKFPVPRPVDVCRHAVVMGLIDGITLYHVDSLPDVAEVYDKLMGLIMRLGRYGLIHGDFNEFNLMLTNENEIIMIDFPQMVSIDHPNAEYYFNRDVQCVRDFFRRKYNFDCDDYPKFEEKESRFNDWIESAQQRLNEAAAADQIEDEVPELLPMDDELLEKYKAAIEETEQKLKEVQVSEDESGEEFHNEDGVEEEVTSANGEKKGKRMGDFKPRGKVTETRSVYSTGSTIAPGDIRKRLMQQKTKTKREKLKVKGKQCAVQRGRKNNQDMIKEYAGWAF
ncbi:hypothetical protein FO519_007293 [Halicephalobus sp. NKZ332]|nr:hypothetical protein FO519_007293 [Halicephalobus sp. NKZ332]